MSAESWKLEKDLCRCCHAEGSFHDLSQPISHILGTEEVYSDMLRSTLNIDMSPMPGLLCTMTYTICDDCALRLRDATHFRQQVMMCEERFKDMYHNVLEALTPNMNALFEIKEEVKEEPRDADTSWLDNYDVPECHEIDTRNCKIEDVKNDKPKKPKAKIPYRKKQNANGSTNKHGGDDTKKGPVKIPKFSLKDIDYKKEGNEFVCKHCDMRYHIRSSLTLHVQTKHYKIALIVCQYCKEEFMSPSRFIVHKLDKHNIDDRFKCQACDAAFHTDKQLRNHRNHFHMLGKKYKCELCEYETFAAGGISKHMITHKPKKDKHCRFCNKSFRRKHTLNVHERIHTGDRRKVCKECGQAFVQKASLNYHMAKYHPSVNF